MIRPLAAVAALFTLALAGAASAQTYGQPVYLDSWGRPVGGSPLSEVETRAYVGTGRWADGYSDRPQVHVPAPYGRRYGYAHGPDRYGYGYDYGYGYGQGYVRGDRLHHRRDSRYDASAPAGYRDEWGYNDDRPPSAQWRSADRGYRGQDRDCGCGDVYPYDR